MGINSLYIRQTKKMSWNYANNTYRQTFENVAALIKKNLKRKLDSLLNITFMHAMIVT